MRGKTAPAPPARPPAAPRQPALPLHLTGYSEQDAPMMARADSLSRPLAPAAATKDPPRQVVCFDCQAQHRVSGSATSTICPGCSTYIDLRDIVVKERNSQRIRTRGDVTVEKKGSLLGTSVHCGNITVQGTISGSIYASGEVLLKSDGKIIGEVRCRRFVLERKCEVQCLQPVHAEEIEIHGHVTGHFYASRNVLISRHASLSGSVSSQSLTVEPGGMVNGQMQVLRPGALEGKRPDVPLMDAGMAAAGA